MGPLLVIRSIIFSLSFLCVLGLMSKMNDVLPRATSKNPSKKIRQQRNNENRKKMTTTKMVFFWLDWNKKEWINQQILLVRKVEIIYPFLNIDYLIEGIQSILTQLYIYVILILIGKHDLTGFLYPKLNFEWVPLI